MRSIPCTTASTTRLGTNSPSSISVIPGTGQLRRIRPRLLDGLGKGLVEYVGHVGGGLTGHHLVGVGVDDGGHLGAVEDEEADPVPTRLSFLGIGDEHPGQTDGDVEVAASSNNVQCGAAGSSGASLVSVCHSSSVSPRKAASTPPTRSPGWLSTLVADHAPSPSPAALAGAYPRPLMAHWPLPGTAAGQPSRSLTRNET